MQYTREDGCKAWLTYALMSPRVTCELLEDYGSAEAIYDRFMSDGPEFLKKYRIGESGIDALKEQCSQDKMHEMMLIMHRLNVGVMSINDSIYPDSLRHIPQPPGVLFYRGDLQCLMGKCVTIVGSRSVSPQGQAVTQRIARDLSSAGVTIVSGLAMGVDAAAHEGCIEGGSPTAAVLACGMDVDYPAENLDLRERIVSTGGVLLSEYPLGMHSGKHVFQMRNRIMSGLSKGVVMMEAKIRSGSMITVQHALEQGRDVFAYPGVPGSEYAEGAHQLLREGAIYFTSAQDLLEDLGWADDAPAITQSQKKELPAMSEEQLRIYTLLGQGEMSFDELVTQSGIPAPQVSVSLTLMQMSGLVRAMPGKSYCRN